ncbi:hypothetical protein JCM8547_006332 [Rhodosporidiobolus lusitaniae]
MSSTPAPPSLLATAHDLHSLLTHLTSPPLPSSLPSSSSSSAVPPPALLHPLGASPLLTPSTLPSLRTHLSSSLASLRSSLLHFSDLALPPSLSLESAQTAGGGEKDPIKDKEKRDRDKFLTSLRDAAGHEATLLAVRQSDAQYADRLLLQRNARAGGGYAALRPEEEEAGGVLKPLERIAGEMGLLGFTDDEGEEGKERVTLSLGGKVMVVDVEVVRAGEGGEKVDKVKVAYVVVGEDRVFLLGGEALVALLSPGAEEGEGEKAQEKKQERWKSVRRVLEELKNLDAATERTGRDCFRAVEELRKGAEEAFGTLSPSPTDLDALPLPSLLLPSPLPTSLLSRFLLSATPSARLSSPFSSFLFSPSSSSPPEGVYTATLSLSCLVNRPLSTSPLSKEEEKQHEHEYVALLDPPVVVTAATGRAVSEALGLAFERKEGEEGKGRKEGGGGKTGASAGAARFEDLLLGAGTEGEEREWKICFPSSSPSSPATSFSFRLAPSSSSPSPLSSRGFLATHLRFSSFPSLRTALALLEAQVRLGEAVSGLERRARGEKRRRAVEVEGEEGGAGKRRRRDEKGKGKGGEMTLDELFSDSSPSPLPIYIHLSSPSTPSSSSSPSSSSKPAPSHPSLTLSFPFPSPSPISPGFGHPTTLVLTALPSSPLPPASSSSSWHAILHPPPSAGADALTKLDGRPEKEEGEGGKEGETEGGLRLERLEKVLEASGDLGLAMRWVVDRLGEEEGRR